MQKTAANPPARCSQEPARCRGAVGTQPTPIASVPMGLPARRCIGLRIWGKTGKTWNCIQLGKLKLGRETGLLPPASVSLPPRQGARPSPALCCCLVASGGGKTTGKQTPWKSEEMQIKREKQTRPNNRAPQGPHSKENGPVSGLPSIWRSQKRRSPTPSPCPGPAGSRKFPLAPQPGIFLGRAFGFGGCGSRCFPVGQGTGPGSGPLSGPACPGPALLRRVPFRTHLGPI